MQSFHTQRRGSLKSKLITSYFIIITIPLLVLTALVYLFFSKTMTADIIRTAQSNNEQVLKNVDTFLNSIIQLSEFPSVDSDIIAVLSKDYRDYGRNSLTEQMSDINFVDAKLYNNIFYMNSNIKSVLLFPQNSKYVYRNLIGSVNYASDYRNKPWYKRITAAKGAYVVFGKHKDYFNPDSSEEITIGRSIINPLLNKFYGVIIISVKDQNIIDLWKDISITKNSFTVLVDENNNLIYQGNKKILYHDLKNIAQKSKQNKSRYFLQKANGQNYFIVCSDTTKYHWQAISVIPMKELFHNSNRIMAIALITITIMTICLVILSVRIANSITNPVKKLRKTMAEVEKGNLDVLAEVTGGEIGILATSFNKMTFEMKQLIARIYIEEKEKRDAELMALQSQINPHFLYNTLESIKVLSQIQGAKGVAAVLDDLVKLLRASSKNNDELITVSEEMDLVENYIKVIRFRYFNRIHFRFDVPEVLLQSKTIKFLLQPVIENCVIHGLPNGKTAVGNIMIRLSREEDSLVFQIFDNGIGIDEKRIKEILSVDASAHPQKFNRIGLYNVNQRIKMVFGAQYGLSIKSKPGFYTKVEARIPYIPGGNTSK